MPELRGFEVFSLGRPAEDMPQITSRICGVCPTAHHMAATKALDDLYKVEPTSAGTQDPRAGLQRLHARRPRAARLRARRAGLHRRPRRAAGRAQHRRRDRQGRPRSRQEGHLHAPAPARADRLLRRQGGPSRCSACPAASARPSSPRTCPSSRNWPRTASSSPQWTLQVFKEIVLEQPGLREDDHQRRLHPQDLLHGHGGRPEQGQFLRRQAPRRGLRRQGSLQVHRRSSTASSWPSTSSRGAT
ncbi:MAG: nickel-dependent hydrogenase large subunit [Ignavibacteriales bacterium]|nr:nickel-dependent hydrogenase large subunit [Ignavibacteriales bacterium]